MNTADMTVEILRLEEGMRDAYVANDLERYFAFFADDSTVLTPQGLINKHEYLETWTQQVGGGARVLGLDYSDMRIRLDATADTAVVVFRVRARIRARDASTTDNSYLETDVWFRRAGTWKLVHAQYAPAPPV